MFGTVAFSEICVTACFGLSAFDMQTFFQILFHNALNFYFGNFSFLKGFCNFNPALFLLAISFAKDFHLRTFLICFMTIYQAFIYEIPYKLFVRVYILLSNL